MDIPKDILDATQARFIKRNPERSFQEARIVEGGPLLADSEERVTARLTRLGVPLADAQAVAGGNAGVQDVADRLPQEARLTMERVLGTNDLVGVAYLDSARAAAKAVGRVVLKDNNGRTVGFGTGWLCSSQVMVTNHHVLENIVNAQNAIIEFEYELKADGTLKDRITLSLDPSALFLTSDKLDYTFVAVHGDTAAFGWLPLFGSADKNLLGESLSIVQHPSGEPKQIALRENRLVDRLPNFLHYETDTSLGSSGSPVFNDSWEVVALHHSGVPRKDNTGQVLKRDGTPLQAGEPDTLIDWVANEGVRVSRLVEDLRTRPDAQNNPLVNEILAANRSAVPEQTVVAVKPTDQVSKSVTSKSVTSESVGTLDLGSIKVDVEGRAIWPVTLQLKVTGPKPQTSPVPAPTNPTPPISTPPTPVSPTPVSPTPVSPTPVSPIPVMVTPSLTQPYLDPADADKAKAKAYYAGILGAGFALQGGKAFFLALSELLTRTHTRKLAYAPMVQVYPWVDLWPDGKLRSIYSGQEYSAEEFIAADLAASERRMVLASQENFTLEVLEDAIPYNCEHVVPQSWFGKREPMKGDLHHLFSCEPNCNSFRGNTPYFDFPDYGEVIRSGCGRREPSEFEPAHGKSAVARATLYFLLRYPGVVRQYGDRHLQTLLAWHQTEAPTDWEKHRNTAIFEKQGNRNPLIDHPEWANQIDFSEGIGR